MLMFTVNRFWTMKKWLLALGLTSLIHSVAAQSYGQKLFSHPGFSITGAAITGINSAGFLRVGLKPNAVPASTVNFFIEKADTNGLVSGVNDFNINYAIKAANSTCSSPLNQFANCYGVSVIETNIPKTVPDWYALCGAFDKGVFFATLNSFGVPVITNSFLFPFIPTSITKPILLESVSSPNNYYIAGACDTNMYVLKVNASGQLLWSSLYHSGAMIPHDLIENPYNNDLVIVGDNTPALSYSLGPQAFFLGLNKSNGNISNYTTYGDSPCHGFSSIKVANSPTGGQGFILGGNSDPYNNLGSTWFLKMGITGNVIWSTIIEPRIGFGGGPVIDVVEHFDPAANTYNYYGITTQALYGMIVLKLDDYGQPAPGNNHFIYNGGANWSSAAALTAINTGPNKGLQLHGTDNELSTNNYYFVRTDFNGNSNCTQTLTTIYQSEAGATATITPWLMKTGSLTACSGFTLQFKQEASVYSTCSPMGIDDSQNAEMANDFTLYPNPVSDKLVINPNSNDTYKVTVYDYLGQMLYEITDANSNQKMDLSDWPKGLYFVELEKKNDKKVFKVVKE
jgi:hypothetical protein